MTRRVVLRSRKAALQIRWQELPLELPLRAQVPLELPLQVPRLKVSRLARTQVPRLEVSRLTLRRASRPQSHAELALRHRQIHGGFGVCR